MKVFWMLPIAALVSLVTIHAEQSFHFAQTETKATSSFDGTWEGKTNDLPSIELKLKDSSGKISGTMVSYLQERSNPSEPWHVSGGTPGPILVPHLEGRILTFETEHHKCHTCAELGPNVRFRVEFTGPNEARLWMNPDESKNTDPGLKLVRRPESELPPDTAKLPKR